MYFHWEIQWISLIIFVLTFWGGVKTLTTLRKEVKILIEILKSDNPKEVEEYFRKLRQNGQL